MFTFPTRGRYTLQGGRDGLKTMSQMHIRQGLDQLTKIDEVSMLAIPDLMFQEPLPPQFLEPVRRCDAPEADTDFPLPENEIEYPPGLSSTEIALLQMEMIAQCEDLKDRVAILDVPPHVNDVPSARAWRNSFDSKYAAIYFPWLRVPDVLLLGGELLRSVPPSGHIAGVYARGDRTTGVHKPPANEALEGVQAVTVDIDDIGHGMLNERAINAIRPYPGRGVRVAGARTLSSDALWRYVNVRRLMSMIEEAVEEQLQWVAFENNHPDLWRELSRLVRSFLDDLWRRGMLDGLTAEQAYTVTCDETTNPPAEIDQGRLICQIGVLPPWPAEFVIVRIGKTEYGTQIVETRENGNG
jgi:phage tail sheath protein FI